MSHGAPAGQRARIAALIEPVVAAAGYDLEDLTVTAAGRRSIVRVVVDADGGINLDDIADVSRGISDVLDGAEESEQSVNSGSMFGVASYTLEVTSPGVDRPLTEPRHWRRNIGRLVKVRYADRTATARITTADEDKVGLDFHDSDGEPRLIAYSELGPGKVQVEFGRPATDPSGDSTEEER